MELPCSWQFITLVFFNIFFCEAFLILNNSTNTEHYKTGTRGSAVAQCAVLLPDKMWVQKRDLGCAADHGLPRVSSASLFCLTQEKLVFTQPSLETVWGPDKMPRRKKGIFFCQFTPLSHPSGELEAYHCQDTRAGRHT